METLILSPDSFAVHLIHSTPGIRAAMADVARDIEAVLGVRPELSDASGLFTVAINSELPSEVFRIDIGERVEISGGDELGAIYGLYEFSHRFLGVDPCGFWKDLSPEALEKLELPRGRIESAAPVFKIRGWFLNDEDLLAGWKEPAGSRFMNWPGRAQAETLSDEVPDNYDSRLLYYYTAVPPLSLMEKVFETALRMRANLIIPSSFLDIMNEPEADMIRAAVRRGLYVSQHHVEPLGVAHFAYETWWAENGEEEKNPPFSYRQDPDAMRTCWRAYAERWYAVAGERVIWQVGLRGRGDRPLWDHDPEAREAAASLYSQALTDQLEIIAEVDARPQPLSTMTLWQEGVELIRSGDLHLPESVICVFADNGRTQEMQEDFKSLPREPQRKYGVYYHVAVWPFGPHLAQGPHPEKPARVAKEVADRGDTDYAILNVSNIREHLLGISVWMDQVWKPQSLDTPNYLRHWAPAEWTPFYEALFDALPEMKPGWNFYDGSARIYIDSFIRHAEMGLPVTGSMAEEFYHYRPLLLAAIPRLEELREDLKSYTPAPRWQSFYSVNLVAQTGILLGLYRCLKEISAMPPDYAVAAEALSVCLASFKDGEVGIWKEWYRSDRKLGIARLQARLQKLL
ncbi:glycosyl hydrolase 115 family protein [Kiritimatiellota bacterium B12222]|nr:glycosyl hydrolase 115 family protein [Kiritimatiellota bacterium B12222]